MTEEQKLEYQTLRSEYSLLADAISSTVTYSVGGIITIYGYIFSIANLSFALFILPLLIIFPACYIIISRLQSIIRLASYITVFLEPLGDLKYETRYLEFIKLSKTKIKFSRTIILMYSGLLFIDVFLFVYKGFYMYYHILFYLSSTALFIYVIYLFLIDWRKQYISYWKTIKNSEFE